MLCIEVKHVRTWALDRALSWSRFEMPSHAIMILVRETANRGAYASLLLIPFVILFNRFGEKGRRTRKVIANYYSLITSREAECYHS